MIYLLAFALIVVWDLGRRYTNAERYSRKRLGHAENDLRRLLKIEIEHDQRLDKDAEELERLAAAVKNLAADARATMQRHEDAIAEIKRRETEMARAQVVGAARPGGFAGGR